MKVFSNFSPLIKILVWIMFGISIAVTVLSLLIVFGVHVPLEINPAHALVLLFSSTIVAVFAIMLNTVYYKVGKTHLQLKIAFFDMLGGRIRLDCILNIVIRTINLNQDDETKKPKLVKEMYISYIWQGQDPVIAKIAIKPKHFEKMKNALLDANPNIVVFDQDVQN